MIHLVSQSWKRSNRFGKIESILTALNRSGTAEAEYFIGKSNIVLRHLWKGEPHPVNQNDEWNYVRIIYEGKEALNFLELSFHPFKSAPMFEGLFFDEKFTEKEIQYVLEALDSVEIITYRTFLTKGKRLLLSFELVLSSAFILVSIMGGYYFDSVLLYFISFIFAYCALYDIRFLTRK